MQAVKIKKKIFLSYIIILLSTILTTHCNLIGSSDESNDIWMLLFGINTSSDSKKPIPELRLNGYLRDLAHDPLAGHGIEYDGITQLTSSTGYISLYLNQGSHTFTVSNQSSEKIGEFSFDLGSEPSLPTITYSAGALFIIEWDSIIHLPQNTIDLSAGQAEVVINELAPGMPSNTDYVELYVTKGGNLIGTSICVRTSCIQLPEVRVYSGEYIVVREGSGTNDIRPSDGLSSTAWDFYDLPNMVTTDAIVYIKAPGNDYESVVFYANNNDTWHGCNGSAAIYTCATEVLAAGKWTIVDAQFDESDSVLKNPPGSFESNDTILRCPNGSSSIGKDAFVYTSNIGDRSTGTANNACPGFHLTAAESLSPNSVTATFNANPTIGGNTLANYSIYEGSACTGTQLPISSVSLTGSTATLTTSSQTQGKNYAVCVNNIEGVLGAIGGKIAYFTGYAPKAILSFNEVAPALPEGTDYVEFYTITGGSTSSIEYCYRSNCINFPDRILEAGDYIVFFTVSGTNNNAKSEGNPNYWEFYGAHDLVTTDGVLYLKSGSTIQSALAYENGNGDWTGCGTTGDTTCLDDIITQSKWSKAGGAWAVTDAIQKNPPASFGKDDTLVKIPNGTGVDSLSTWKVYSTPALRTMGSQNIEPVSINPGDLVINEVRRRTNAHFFEIRNTTSSDINLSISNVYFYRAATCQADLSTTTWTNKIALTGTIPANGYYLVSSVGLDIGEGQVNSHSFGTNTCAILSKSATPPPTIGDSSILDLVGWGTSAICKGNCATDLATDGILRRVSGFELIATGNNSTEFEFVPDCIGTPLQANDTSGGCLPKAETPTYDLLAGTYPVAQDITISSTNASFIRYTIDGTTTPDCKVPGDGTTLTGNSGTVTIATTTTLQAIGCNAGVGSSSVATSIYTILPPNPVASSSSPSGTGVLLKPDISVTFDREMDIGTITTNTDTSCSGSIQVSKDGFTTCVPMSGSPTPSVGDTVFTITPNNDLETMTVYTIKVTTAVKESGGNVLATEYISSFTTGTGIGPTNLIINGSFEDDTNSCQKQNSPTGCPNSWIYVTGANTSTLSAVSGSVPTGGGSNYGIVSTWTTLYSGREIQTNCFLLDKSKDLELKGYFYKDTSNNTKIRYLVHYFTDSGCNTSASTQNSTMAGQDIDTINTWEEKSDTVPQLEFSTEATLYVRIGIQGQRASAGIIRFDLFSATQP